jgi:hypothetical protein
VASVDRLETGLGLLYGSGPRALDVPRASEALWQLGGVYLGEVLRHSCAGRWQASGELKEAVVLVAGRELRPFQIVRNRIAHGRHATLASALAPVLEQSQGKLERSAGTPAACPPLPWGERAWPPLEDLPRLGRALAHSVVAVYAAQHGVPALDRTSKSLPALDRYLALVAPVGARLPEDTPWTRWLSVFVGAYLGEVLCRDFGGVWVGADGSGARAVAVQLGKRRIAPLMLILDIVTGRAELTLQEFAGDLRHGTAAPSRSRG